MLYVLADFHSSLLRRMADNEFIQTGAASRRGLIQALGVVALLLSRPLSPRQAVVGFVSGFCATSMPLRSASCYPGASRSVLNAVCTFGVVALRHPQHMPSASSGGFDVLQAVQVDFCLLDGFVIAAAG